ncbi:MAG: Putative endonuclease [Thermoanaerobacterales bacterium 50_218]|nr:MAG: Putative endonuclease [Thermoanaerobacterales bacterium 50_218]HAA89611.1 endonuclease [Peptococcaceae bacterium]
MYETLIEIYERLYRHFGPRYWWPADTPFEVIVGAILTQNVAWRSAATAIENLKKANLLFPEAILSCGEEELAALVRPARYHFQKAKKLRAICSVIVNDFRGDLDAFLGQDLETLRKCLLGIYGIGPETADAIILYAAEKPIFVVDAYTHRIFYRLGYFPEKMTYREMQQFFMENLPPDTALYNEYHAQIDALGHHICLKRKPRCGECPLKDICLAYLGVPERLLSPR